MFYIQCSHFLHYQKDGWNPTDHGINMDKAPTVSFIIARIIGIIILIIWLVVWSIFSTYCNWRSHIFQRGRSTTNQIIMKIHHPSSFFGKHPLFSKNDFRRSVDSWLTWLWSYWELRLLTSKRSSPPNWIEYLKLNSYNLFGSISGFIGSTVLIHVHFQRITYTYFFMSGLCCKHPFLGLKISNNGRVRGAANWTPYLDVPENGNLVGTFLGNAKFS